MHGSPFYSAASLPASSTAPQRNLPRPSAETGQAAKPSLAHPGSAPVQAVWLRRANAQHSYANHVLQHLRSLGLPVREQLYAMRTLSTIDQYDLILVEAPGLSIARINYWLRTLRQFTDAPLVVLLGQAPVDFQLTVLTAGADAALPLTTPPEVILAHCYALLRRWRGGA